MDAAKSAKKGKMKSEVIVTVDGLPFMALDNIEFNLGDEEPGDKVTVSIGDIEYKLVRK